MDDISCLCGGKCPGGGDNSVTTKDVVVQADRAKEEAKWESQSTTVITAEDIERKQGKSVEDVIFNEVGVTRTVDAMGKVGISIRGADPRHTLIMVDGQPVLGDVAKYNGNGDELMRIGAENIERIEIVRGAASAKYGSDAIGGVVNVITKKSGKDPSFHFNAEARYHTSRYDSSNESSALPSNFYMRADSGQIGNFSISGWTSKRYIMPVYKKNGGFYSKESGNWSEDFKPSLRYYGDISDSGVTGEYKFNDDHKISFKVQHEKDNLQRRNKNADPELGIFASFEPIQIFKRNINRDTYAFNYDGRAGNTDWTFSVNRGKTYETNVTTATYYAGGQTVYSGMNTLYSVDWLKHDSTNINADFHTAAGDKHYISYGMGYTKEKATGTRLRNAPKTWTESIDPWDYDKSLQVADNTASVDDKPLSKVHNYEFEQTDSGLIWNKNKEYYGSTIPPITYDEFVNWKNDENEIVYGYTSWGSARSGNAYDLWKAGNYEATLQNALDLGTITKEDYDKYINIGNTLGKKYDEFDKILKSQNNLDALYEQGVLGTSDKNSPVEVYFIGPQSWTSSADAQKYILYNGQYYGQGFEERENQVQVGEASLTKYHFYIQDNWQINDNTIFMPSLRLDHSDMFGSKVTGNFGVTHNLNGNPHRRLKANIGTGYSEPGLGELYYNWEMFGGTSSDSPGWYWIGNKDLKPETSVNFDVSLEGENKKTYAKVSLFHNEIKNYMTSYFTGQLIDFNFNGETYAMNADRIYSFRNLGKAKITGLEAEIQQQFNKNWSAKLGYTWLHAMNDSDKDMPDRLLDRPTHKFDISLNYKNDKGDFRGALWGSYYVNMLDSNSVSTNDLYEKDSNNNYIRKKASYNEKSFGLWNLLLEKDLNKDFTVYVGIDNIFNHRDDDRAFQDRVYRAGINMKLDDIGHAIFGDNKPVFKKDADGNPIITNIYGESWFLSRPNDIKRKAGDVELYGEYALQSSMYKGENKASMRETKTTQADDNAARNYVDKSDHGLEQKARFGVNYQITDDMNLDVVGATSRRDTSYSVSDKRGLHDAYLEKAELNKKANKWDWTIGRIHEPMGVTGYWFGQEYDGVRAMYTDNKTQVVIGYGDFSQTTGVTDSAYNHKEEAVIHRAPTLNELLGMVSFAYEDINAEAMQIYKEAYEANGQYNYLEKFNAAGCVRNSETGEWEADPSLTNIQIAEAKLAVIRELVSILKSVDTELKAMGNIEPTDWSLMESGDVDTNNFDYQLYNQSMGTRKYFSNFRAVDITIQTADGQIVDLSQGRPLWNELDGVDLRYNSNSMKYGGLEGLLHMDNIKQYMSDVLDKASTYYNNGEENTYLDHTGNVISRDEAINQMIVSFVGTQATYNNEMGRTKGDNAYYNAVSKFIQNLARNSHGYDPVQEAPIPLPGAPIAFAQQGYLLKQDKIPAMDRAAFVKIRQQVADNIGLEAWKLNSFGEGAYDANGREMRIADVLGLGAKIRLGSKSMLSFDYGQNHSDMGKYFHGGNAYGIHDGGSTPDFWVARLDVGIADTDVPGSWNAYFDYKSFDHGAFLGGTGADLPDRYLDGIRSFTAGFGYVPARNFLLEASYTFDAHSTQQRDTLYTPESFSLGDYTRVTLTYKF